MQVQKALSKLNRTVHLVELQILIQIKHPRSIASASSRLSKGG